MGDGLMATTKGDEEQLAINIVAKLNDLEKQMARANGITAKAYREMSLGSKRATTQMSNDAIRSSVRVKQAMASVSASVGTFGKSFAAATAAFIGVNQIAAASQAYIRAENALKVAGKSGDDLANTFQRLYGIAQANSTPIETLVGLYSKAAQAQSSLKASDEQLLAFTTMTAQALRVQGKSAEESSGAMLQLGQALGGSKIQAEEYNSLIDGARPLLQAVAAGLKEAGGDVSKLTALVKDGKVSVAAFFNAGIAGAPVLEQKLAGAQKTVAQAGIEFSNAMIGLVGAIDKAVGATPKVAGALSAGSKQIETATGFVNDLAASYERLTKAMATAPRYNAYGTAPGDIPSGGQDWYSRTYGSATPRPPSTAGQDLAEIQKRLNAEQERRLAEARNPNVLMQAYDGKITAPTPKVKPVSLKDYPVLGDGDKTEKLNDYEREIRSIQERTDALRAEIPVVGQSAAEQAKAAEVQKLKTAAEREGLALTPERLAEIERVASAYGAETAALEKVKTAHEEHQELLRFAGQEISSFFSDIVSGGKNAEEALMNLTKRLTDALLQASLLGDGPLAGLLGLKGANGNVGGLIGGLSGLFSVGAPLNIIPSAAGNVFASSGLHAYSNKVVDRPALFAFASGAGLMGEAGPEAIMPLQRDASGRLGVATHGGGGQQQAQAQKVDVGVTVDDDGGLRAYVKRVSATTMAASVPAVAKAAESRVATRFASGGFDKIQRGRYGITPTTVKR
jgi:tape measure domain-containing protein